MRLLVNAVKSTLAKREGACMNRLRSTIGIKTSAVSEDAFKTGH